ncbi:MAG: hypothetical protein C0602_02700 [Denitrovibrio sp.]|nr:MAG: hypothetical protein C0602_02700 [Denitrovibrio sp.]
MKRIFYDGDLSDSLELQGDYFHYLKNVVRAKPGDILGVLTLEEFAEVQIDQIEKRSASLRVLNKRPALRHDYKLKVYQCLLKREYMDFAVEKYAELGATEIVPVISERSLNDLKEKTMKRYLEISLKAVLQSENEQLPVIHEAIDISKITADAENNILFYERQEGEGKIIASKNMSIIIGPEGGFTDEEYKILLDKGFQPVKPISQILKAETASVVFTGYIRILQEQM